MANKIVYLRKCSALFLTLLLFLGMFSCKTEKQKATDRNEIVENTIRTFETIFLKAEVDSIIARHHFNGIVSVFRDSVRLVEKANGFADFKNKKKIDSATVFAIGSISKQFTAVMILQLVEQGKLKLSDPVSQYLPAFEIPSYREISVQQLLNHTSGLNILGNALLFKSGTDFHYSNDGYNSLGKVIEKISGKSFSQNAKILFSKAGLKSTFTPDSFHGPNFGSAYLGSLENASEVPDMPKRLSTNAVGAPAGGILSTVRDLHRWNSKLYGGEILKPETLKLMTTATATRMEHFFGKVGYGDGIMLYGKDFPVYFHTGYVKGAPSLNLYYPATNTSVVVLSNVADETKGKKYIFTPHLEIRRINDALQNSVYKLRRELLQKVEK